MSTELRKWQKKMRGIEKIEEKVANGEPINPDEVGI